MELLAPVTGTRGAVWQPWSGELTSTIEGPVTVFPAGTTARTGCTTIVSPTAREIPRIYAAVIPENDAGKMTRSAVCIRVAPIA